MFIAGDTYYGKVDRLPGFFHVATRFLHVWWIPLIPRESYVIQENTGEKRGVQIPLCRRSVIKAYICGFATMFTIVFFSAPILIYFDERAMRSPNIVSTMALMAVLGCSALGVACWFARASLPTMDRAMELSRLAGFEPQLIASEVIRAERR